MKRKTDLGALLIALTIVILTGTALQAQDEPYIVHQTRPLIIEGPYLVAPSNDGVSVVWKTDTECHSRVEYGLTSELEEVAESIPHGLLPVGSIHAIRLSGLESGKTYQIRAISTRIVRMKAYWPEKGLSAESEIISFTVPDPGADTVSFDFLADTQHENLRRLAANLDIINWNSIDFLVHGGDAFGSIENEDQLFDNFLRPVTERLENKAMVFVRGNHEMRGSFARRIYEYFPTRTGEFYYSFDSGPVHFIVLDTGEDKDDDTNVYAGLNRTEPYREKEFAWLQEHVRANERLRDAPFRIILMHDPNWGWVDGNEKKWTELANRSGVDLVIAGHRHRYSWTPPGPEGRNYGVLVVGQDQAAHVEATSSVIKAVITDTSGEVAGEIKVSRRD